MTLDTERVVFLRYTRGGAGRRGSGLRVGATLVLTADHCARGSDHAVIVAGKEYGATVAWRSGRDDVDIAVLHATGLPAVDPLAYARINTATGALIEGCVALGFPAWNGYVRAQVNGYVPTGEGGNAFAADGAPENAAFKITTPAIRDKWVDAGDQDKETSPWGGMSGAVIVTRDDQIVGVVQGHVPKAGVGSLMFTPLAAIDTLAAETAAEFWALLGVEDPHALPVLPLPVRMPRVLQLRSLAELDPINDLGVHPAVEAGTSGRLPELPRYVPRDHDARLRKVAGEAAGGASRLVVVVGGSSTGKTRACQEMLASLPQWCVWQPLNPTPSEAVLAGLPQVGPRTVVWLDEAQLYLLSPDDTGERVAAGLWELLRDERCRPVLVVATLWPEYWTTLTTRVDPDRHPLARRLLSGHDVDVPESFSPGALSMLAQQADADPRLAEAADQAVDGQITQYLAGGPFLLDRYEMARPSAHALISVAMDARRMGCDPHLPLALLECAVPGYLTGNQWDELDDHWLDRDLAYAAQPFNGIPGPLTRIRPRPDHTRRGAGTGHDAPSSYRLADYLDQYGRRQRHALIPPSSFWTAATCAQPADLTTLAEAAAVRGLSQAAAQLLKEAAARGDPDAGAELIAFLDELLPGDSRPARWAGDIVADLTDPGGVARLLGRLWKAGAQEQVAALLARDPAAHVNLDDLHGVEVLIHNLLRLGAKDQVTALIERAARRVSLDNGSRLAKVLVWLRADGAQDQLTALLARDPAAHVTLDDSDGVSRLLDELRRVGARDQVIALLARDPAAHFALDPPPHLPSVLNRLLAAGAQDQAAALAERVATQYPLDNATRVAFMLQWLLETGAQEQVGALLARDPAAHVLLDDPVHAGVRVLMMKLREVGAEDQVTALLERVTRQVSLFDPGDVAVLLTELRVAGAQVQITALLARDPAAHISLDNPTGVARLLDSLRQVGAQDQITVLLARDPATHVTLDDPAGVSELLDRLRQVGEQDQVSALLARDPAEHVILDGSSNVKLLVDSLREADAQDQVTVLVDRLPGAGLFEDFCAQGNNQTAYRFGRNLDGSPSKPWGWDDLA